MKRLSFSLALGLFLVSTLSSARALADEPAFDEAYAQFSAVGRGTWKLNPIVRVLAPDLQPGAGFHFRVVRGRREVAAFDCVAAVEWLNRGSERHSFAAYTAGSCESPPLEVEGELGVEIDYAGSRVATRAIHVDRLANPSGDQFWVVPSRPERRAFLELHDHVTPTLFQAVDGTRGREDQMLLSLGAFGSFPRPIRLQCSVDGRPVPLAPPIAAAEPLPTFRPGAQGAGERREYRMLQVILPISWAGESSTLAQHPGTWVCELGAMTGQAVARISFTVADGSVAPHADEAEVTMPASVRLIELEPLDRALLPAASVPPYYRAR